jgi:uncharacterized membrane protein
MKHHSHSETERIKLFSDGFFAIIITIMVLEIHPPNDATLHALLGVLPSLLSYILSFLYLGIYWNNHHHLLHATDTITGGMLWANLHLLFWLSLIPFATSWIGRSVGGILPTVLYGIVLLMAACAYFILQSRIIMNEGKESRLAKAIGKDPKGKASLALYLLAIATSFLQPWIAYVIFAIVAILWIVPDKRLQKFFDHLDD